MTFGSLLTAAVDERMHLPCYQDDSDWERNRPRRMRQLTFGRPTLERRIANLAVLLPFPHRREIDLALGASIRLRHQAVVVQLVLVLGDVVDDRFEAQHVHELGVARIRYEMHLWRRRLRWRYL